MRNILIGRDRFDDLGLVVLADMLEVRHRLVARQHAARHGNPAWRSRHALLDCRQVFRRKRALVGEIVVETVFDDRPMVTCASGTAPSRMGQQVRRRMADNLDTVCILVGDDRQRGICSIKCETSTTLPSTYPPTRRAPNQHRC